MKVVAIDFETQGLYPKPGAKIFCCAINDGKTIRVETDILKLKALFEDPNILKVIHNAAFEGFWLKMVYNIDLVNVWDTMLMEQLIIGDILPRDTNISEATKEELSAALYYVLKRYGLAVLDKSLGAKFATRNPNAPLTKEEKNYVSNDVRYLLMLRALQERRLIKLDLMRVANLENKCVEVVFKMRAYGIGIDVKEWLKIADGHSLAAAQILKKMPLQVSNWNSPAQVKKYFNSNGVGIQSLTDLKDGSIAEFYNNDVLNKFMEMRKHNTMCSKYGANFLTSSKDGRYFVDADSRIRADFDQIMNTGRLSCSNPPLHGLPREGTQRGAMRSRKGYVFVRGDFSGQETGIMAAASGEELWIKALLRGEDPLSLMASLMFKDWSILTEKGCTFPKKCACKGHKKLRQISKEITYGIAYGAYPLSISKKIKRTKKETEVLFYKHKRAAPKLNRWLEANAKETIKTRISYSADIYRRRRTVRDPEEWMVRNVGYNNPVQASAANMIKLSMISLPSHVSPSNLLNIVMPWHDELILEVKNADAKKAVKILKGVMEKAADYCTGIKGLIKVSPIVSTSLAK